ncbi:MAG: MEKHLA domain-containing protein [Deltaproteobacteria bacterium]|nr:MEKHLA domain-containing protein [Deltaproteobacteria bacterium]
MDAPCVDNDYLQDHVMRLLAGLRHWTGRNLVDPMRPVADQARQIYYASFAVLSHDISADPLLNYANQAALTLFELSWEELVITPSRLTAEAIEREQRARLLATVGAQGYIDDYRGVRISKSGRRFEIERATVWNLFDEQGAHYGQAAAFSVWRSL